MTGSGPYPSDLRGELEQRINAIEDRLRVDAGPRTSSDRDDELTIKITYPRSPPVCWREKGAG